MRKMQLVAQLERWPSMRNQGTCVALGANRLDSPSGIVMEPSKKTGAGGNDYYSGFKLSYIFQSESAVAR